MTTPGVVVTGAGGFVGSALAAGFLALRWQVTAVDVAFDDETRARLAGANVITADLGGSAPEHLPAGPLVVHAAAITTDRAELGWTRAAYLAANTRPLLAMLEHAAHTRPASFVYVSSSGVFAADDGDGALADTTPPTGQSPYAVAKRLGELLVRATLEGVCHTHVVRLGYVYGPYETSRPSRARVSLVARWRADARAGRPLAVRADDPRRDWTYAPDLAPALARFALDDGPGRPVHLGSPHVLRDSVLAAMVMRLHPGADRTIEPAATRTKPPMAPSDIPALRGFAWTDPATGLAALSATEAAA